MVRLALLGMLIVGCTDPVPYGGERLDTAIGAGTTGAGTTGTNTGGTNTAGTNTGGTNTGGAATGTTTGTVGGGNTGGTTTGGTGSPPGTFSGGCGVVIPPDATVVDSDDGSGDDFKVFWVCSHAVLSYWGSNSWIILEDSAEVVLNGTDNVVWMTSNAKAAVFVDPNEVIHEPSATINDESNYGVVLNQCGTLSYDISQAPANGC